MNPMTNMKNIKKLSEQELKRSFKTTWHDQYRNSAWIFVGGLPYDLTEGDVICIFSQYGEIVNINLVRDKETGKQKGFCFICYEDQRSTDLAVDNFNGITILKRTIRVDHVNDYKMPKDHKSTDAETRQLHKEGCGPNVKRPQLPIPSTELPAFAKEEEAPPDAFRLPPRLPIGQIKIEKEDEDIDTQKVKVKKEKKSKKSKKNKKKKSKKKKKKQSSSESSNSDEDNSSESEPASDEEKRSKEIKTIKSKSDSSEEISKNYSHKSRNPDEGRSDSNKDMRRIADNYRNENRHHRNDFYKSKSNFYEKNDRKREYDSKDQNEMHLKRYRH